MVKTPATRARLARPRHSILAARVAKTFPFLATQYVGGALCPDGLREPRRSRGIKPLPQSLIRNRDPRIDVRAPARPRHAGAADAVRRDRVGERERFLVVVVRCGGGDRRAADFDCEMRGGLEYA